MSKSYAKNRLDVLQQLHNMFNFHLNEMHNCVVKALNIERLDIIDCQLRSTPIIVQHVNLNELKFDEN